MGGNGGFNFFSLYYLQVLINTVGVNGPPQTFMYYVTHNNS